MHLETLFNYLVAVDPQHFGDLVRGVQTLSCPSNTRTMPFEQRLRQPERRENGFPPDPVQFHRGFQLLTIAMLRGHGSLKPLWKFSRRSTGRSLIIAAGLSI